MKPNQAPDMDLSGLRFNQGRAPKRVERHKSGRMAAGHQETMKIFGADGGGCVIAEGVEIDRVKVHQGPIQQHRHPVFVIIHDGERRNRAWGHAQHFRHQFPRRETEPASAKQLGQGAQIHHRLRQCRQKEEAALFVFQEQILSVPPGHRGFDRATLRDGEDRGMFMGAVGDAQFIEQGK